MSDYLEHHGILGQKWGVRRFQNPDGTVTQVGRKRYNKELRADKKERRRLESKAYDDAHFERAFINKYNSINKKYKKSLTKDPVSKKTKRLQKDKEYLALGKKAYHEATQKDIDDLKKLTDSMINKYKDTKVKEISTKKKNDGVEYIRSAYAGYTNGNATYSLTRYRTKDGSSIYVPTKTRHYVMVY